MSGKLNAGEEAMKCEFEVGDGVVVVDQEVPRALLVSPETGPSHSYSQPRGLR